VNIRSIKVIVFCCVIVGFIACSTEESTKKNNIVEFTANLSNAEVVAGSTESASGVADFSYDSDNQKLTGNVTISNSSPIAVDIHNAYAGITGAPVFSLIEQSKTTWVLAKDSQLTDQQLLDLQAGRFYVKAQFSDGLVISEIRGQILSDDIEVFSTALKPPKNQSGAGRGYAAITLDTKARSTIVYATVSEFPVNELSIGHIHDILNPTSIAMTLHSESSAIAAIIYRSEPQILSEANINQLRAGRLYINLHSGTAPNLLTELTGAFGYDENDIMVIDIGLSSAEVVASDEGVASGVGQLNIHRQTGGVSGYVQVDSDNIMVDAVHIHDAFAGLEGDIVANVAFSSSDGKHWQVTNNSFLNETQLSALSTGGYYINIHYLDGQVSRAIRGQLLPANIEVFISRLTSESSDASGFVGITLDKTSNNLTIYAQVVTPAAETITLGRLHDHFDPSVVVLDLTKAPLVQTNEVWTAQFNVEPSVVDQLESGLLDITLYSGPETQQVAAMTGSLRDHEDTVNIPVILSNGEVITGSDTSVRATANLMLERHTRVLSGELDLSVDSVAHSVQLHDAYAGSVGEVVVPFQALSNTKWKIADDLILTSQQSAALLVGRYYLNVSFTEASVSNEIRGQVLPSNIDVHLAWLAPPESTISDVWGYAALTLNRDSLQTVVHARVYTDTPEVIVSGHIHSFHDPKIPLIFLTKVASSNTNESVWTTLEGSYLSASSVDRLQEGQLYIHLHRSVNPSIVEATGNFFASQNTN